VSGPLAARFLTDTTRAAVLLALADASDGQLCGALFSGPTSSLPPVCLRALASYCEHIVAQNRGLLDNPWAKDDPQLAASAESNILTYQRRVDEFTVAAAAAAAAVGAP